MLPCDARTLRAGEEREDVERSRITAAVVRVLPGLALAGAAAAVVAGTTTVLPGVPALPAAVLLGLIAGNLGVVPDRATPGLAFASRTLLRAGIVLLGLRLTTQDLAAMGWPTVIAVIAVVVVALGGVLGIARLAGAPRAVGLLTAVGFAICGASAVAAAQAVVDAEEGEVAMALGNVLLFGTVSLLVLPLAVAGLGLGDVTAGMWIGAAVNDVGQTVATAGAVSEDALQAAVVVKLGRVALLAPVLLGIGLMIRRSTPTAAEGGRTGGSRPPLVPLFVVGFLVVVGLRSVGLVPEAAVQLGAIAEQVAIAMALFALGVGVRIGELRALGARPLVLGPGAWVLVTGFGLAAVHLAGAAGGG